MNDPYSQFEPHRAYLELYAEARIEPKLRRKIDAQDVVQEAFLAAYQGIDSMPKTDENNDIRRWLTEILKHELFDLRRKFYSQKRNLRQERSVDANMDQFNAGIEALVPADHTSPSGAANRNEQTSRLAKAIRDLKACQREVILERYINGRSIQEICEIVEKSPSSVAGLLYRGMARMRDLLK